ncbi:MAG TPA: sigma-70 family RNA polymerase sigma factor [Arachidicoccus sp.]|nr:sigma-70 family RNA polymerase sigma factor [Arachidicoccus sp.]
MNRLQAFKQFSDEQIVKEVLQGHKALFELIIRRYNSYLFKVGRSYGFNHADTEDLMQEAYVAAYGHLANFENRASFKTWLVKIMLHECYHKKAKFSYQKESPDPFLSESTITPMFTARSSSSDQVLVLHELKHVIENALLSIPEDFRLVFTLRELSGLNTQETADALGITPGNVKTRLNRAKGLLRSAVHKMYTPEDIFEFNLIYCDSMVEKVMQRL